jgi:hypothetical protein
MHIINSLTFLWYHKVAQSSINCEEGLKSDNRTDEFAQLAVGDAMIRAVDEVIYNLGVLNGIYYEGDVSS